MHINRHLKGGAPIVLHHNLQINPTGLIKAINKPKALKSKIKYDFKGWNFKMPLLNHKIGN